MSYAESALYYFFPICAGLLFSLVMLQNLRHKSKKSSSHHD
jgi:hypothetical protein